MSNLEVRLNITNYNPHPDNVNYTVFHFYRDDMATSFESLLTENEIPFESYIEEEPRKIYLFGIDNRYYKKAVRYNFMAQGKHRERFIPNNFFAFFIIGFVLLMVIIAIIGVIINK